VLEVRFQVYAKAEKWEACLEIGTALVKLAPKNPSSYLCHAAALHRLKRTHHAHDQLLHAVRMFPKDWRVRYALARYACRLGKLE
jgi:predicted Zn-dependent protease